MTASASISTPLLAELHPQPAEAPANTKHAAYVEALTPIFKSTPIVATASIIPSTLTTVHQLPYAYASNYVSVPSVDLNTWLKPSLRFKFLTHHFFNSWHTLLQLKFHIIEWRIKTPAKLLKHLKLFFFFYFILEIETQTQALASAAQQHYSKQPEREQ